MGKKYIIELEENEHLYKTEMVLGEPMMYSVFPEPYAEPDTEKIRKEAYDKGFKDGTKKCINCEDFKENAKAEAYQKGLSDAWAAARWVSKANAGVNFEVFCMHFTSEVLLKISASEAIEKIKAYEQKQEQIQVGDEVRNVKSGWTAVVSNIDGECMTLMDTNGVLGDGYDVNRFTKTGRHFPEIAAVLEKMRGEQDG